MKKKLVMIFALCAVGVSENVKAEGSLTWLPISKQQKVTDDKGNQIPINVSNGKIMVTLPPGWSAWIDNNNNSYCRNNLNITFAYELKLPNSLTTGNEFTVSFQGDDGFFVGSVTYKDSQTLQEEYQKELDNQYAEELFRRSVEEEANKTWYQRLGDNIEDTWANVKGWWRG